MKPQLLDSIYYSNQQPQNDVVSFYVKKIYALFVDLLDKSGINNLSEMISADITLSNGKVLKNKLQAGHYFIDYILFSDKTKEEIEKLDKIFLQNIQSDNPEETLEHIKYILVEEASETLDMKQWLEALKNI